MDLYSLLAQPHRYEPSALEIAPGKVRMQRPGSGILRLFLSVVPEMRVGIGQLGEVASPRHPHASSKLTFEILQLYWPEYSFRFV